MILEYENYKTAGNYSRAEIAHGGVMIYTKSSFEAKLIENIISLAKTVDCEIIAAQLNIIH